MINIIIHIYIHQGNLNDYNIINIIDMGVQIYILIIHIIINNIVKLYSQRINIIFFIVFTRNIFFYKAWLSSSSIVNYCINYYLNIFQIFLFYYFI